ncbi:MAG: hypothetical protein WC322_05670 [Candidatus Paceibacterota bacterium]|jgi:hypothetical protein
MSGYAGFSKSNNAVDAEEAGLLTLTATAKQLKVSTEAVRSILSPSEWHHSSKYYNKVDYYDLDEIDAETLAALKAYKPAAKVSREYRADVKWIEWTGTRNHPRAIEHTAENILVTEKGQFYTFHTEAGDVRKKIDSSGTSVAKEEK